MMQEPLVPNDKETPNQRKLEKNSKALCHKNQQYIQIYTKL